MDYCLCVCVCKVETGWRSVQKVIVFRLEVRKVNVGLLLRFAFEQKQ